MAIREDNRPEGIPVLVYHKVDPRFEYSITRVSPERFERHLSWLNAHDYQTITLSEAIRFLKFQIPIPRRTVAIAFDDGFESIYTYALPLLIKYGMTATVFPVVGYTGRDDAWDVNLGGRRFRHLNWNQLYILSQSGIEIGSHTLNHPDLTQLTPRQALYELTKSRQLLQDHLESSADILSCPFGKYSPLVSEIAADAGYTGVVVVRKNETVVEQNRLVIIPGTCVYRTTMMRGLRSRLERKSRGLLFRYIEKGIGWCAGRTSIVKGIPEYPPSLYNHSTKNRCSTS